MSWADSSWADSSWNESAGVVIEKQLSYYEREKRACRLKICCALQLVGSGWYALASAQPGARGFGLLCALAALLGFGAANSEHRRLLQLVSSLSVSHIAHRLM